MYKKCGTPGYVAPEIFKTKTYDQKIDVFSLGVVYYILVYGRMPFEGKDQEEILNCNERGDIDFKIEYTIYDIDVERSCVRCSPTLDWIS